MKKIALLCAALFLLSGCNKDPIQESPSPEITSPAPTTSQPLVTPTPTPTVSITPTPQVTPSEGIPPAVPPTLEPVPSEGWDGNLDTLTLEDFPTHLITSTPEFFSNTDPLRLIAQIPEEDTWLYGVYEPQKEQALILRVGEMWTQFDLTFMTPRGIFPQMAYGDFDGDLDLELALILYTASGTGIAVTELHIIEFGQSGIWTDNHFASGDYQAILDQSVVYRYDPLSRTVTIQAETGSITSILPEDQSDYTGPYPFGDVVSFQVEGDALSASFGAAVTYAGSAIGQYICDIHADVVYTGSAFGLANLQAVPDR